MSLLTLYLFAIFLLFKKRASRPSQGTVNGGAVSKWPRCRWDVKQNQPTNLGIFYSRPSPFKSEDWIGVFWAMKCHIVGKYPWMPVIKWITHSQKHVRSRHFLIKYISSQVWRRGKIYVLREKTFVLKNICGYQFLMKILNINWNFDINDGYIVLKIYASLSVSLI